MDDDNKQHLSKKRTKDRLYEDLALLLFAFGDSQKPKDETVKVLEEYLWFYIDKLIAAIQSRKQPKEASALKIGKQDVIYAIRNDPKALSRMAYIIKMRIEFRKIKDSSKDDVNVAALMN